LKGLRIRPPSFQCWEKPELKAASSCLRRCRLVEAGLAGLSEKSQFCFHRSEKRETAAMDRTWSQFGDGGVMEWCGITLMLGKTVARVNLIELPHDSIACHLGEDACGGNRVAFAITLDKS